MVDFKAILKEEFPGLQVGIPEIYGDIKNMNYQKQ